MLLTVGQSKAKDSFLRTLRFLQFLRSLCWICLEVFVCVWEDAVIIFKANKLYSTAECLPEEGTVWPLCQETNLLHPLCLKP